MEIDLVFGIGWYLRVSLQSDGLVRHIQLLDFC